MGSVLPYKNELGFYEIRMESIGGLGANVSGKIIDPDFQSNFQRETIH